jgi:hypothetical protein
MVDGGRLNFRRVGLLDLQADPVAAFRKRVLVRATEKDGPVFDRQIQLEFSRLPSLDASDAIHADAGDVVARRELDADRAFQRIVFLEFDTAGQLPPDTQTPVVFPELDFDVFVHVVIPVMPAGRPRSSSR